MAHKLGNSTGERGLSLIELMVALVIVSVGVLAVVRLFPAGTQNQNRDRLFTTSTYFAQEEVERLGGLAWSHPDLAEGRHPATGQVAMPISGGLNVGSNSKLGRYYVVNYLPEPLDNLKRVDVTVTYGSRSVTATTYIRR